MNKIYQLPFGVYPFIRVTLFHYVLNSHFIVGGMCLLIGLNVPAQTNNYFGTAGTVTGNTWSINPGGPYTSPLVVTGGPILNFNNAGSAASASIPTTVGINFGTAINWIAGGTIGAAGINLPINVSTGVVQDLNTQGFSTSATAAITKNGAGTLELSGGTFAGGFTLTAGTIIAHGVNAMGNGGLNLNGGVLASDASRIFSAKFSAINIGGDIQFGDVTTPASANANLSFTDPVALDAVNHTLTLGNSGTTLFAGIISNAGTAGISFAATAGGLGNFDISNAANTFSGPININGGKVRFATIGSFGNLSNAITIDGGQLYDSSTYTIAGTHPVTLGATAGTGINVIRSTDSLTIDAVIADKTSLGGFIKYGLGKLVLTKANTYTGTTTIDAAGGLLRLNNAAGNTLPAVNNLVVNGGTLQISSNQTLNNVSLVSGNLTIDNGVTLTINGTFDYNAAGTIILEGTGKIVYGAAGTLQYSGTMAKAATAAEWPVAAGPVNVNINNLGGVSLPALLAGRTITGSLTLMAGNFTIDAGVLLDLDGASLTGAGGFLQATNMSDLTLEGTSGSIATIPLSTNISLRTVTIKGNRTLAMDGTHHINLSGALTIAVTATYDNGGESELLQNGGGTISIAGTFITRSVNGFTGGGSAIPGIIPALNTACTIEYGRIGDQDISIRSDYQNLRFTGGGIKKRSVNAVIAPITGTVTIPDVTTVDLGNFAFGSATTNLTMTDGRLRINGTGTKPDIDGTYTLSGNSVIEFYNSATATNETIKGKNGANAPILYNQIEVNGDKVGNGNANITLNTNGIFTVKSDAIFEINDNSIIAATATTGQSVVVESAGAILCGNNQGFNGFTETLTDNSAIHANIANIILAAGSTINYAKAGNQPITVANSLIYSNLILSGSGDKTAPAGVLTVQGDLTKPGACTFVDNGGTVLLNGTTQSFAGLTYNNIHLDNAGTKILSGNATVVDSLRIGNLATDPATILAIGTNYFTLRSTSSKTARLGTVAPAATITYGTGRFVVERHYTSHRAWRLVTAPVTADAGRSVFSAWQLGGGAASGSGIFVTGPNAPAGGLDPSPLNNFSFKTYDGINLNGVGNTKITALSGTAGVPGTPDNYGMFVFVRGDRSSTSLFNPYFSNETTLQDTGKVQVKTQVFNLTGPVPGYSLIGNPYASPVDMDTIMASATGIDNDKYYMYDPYINLDQGGYLTYTADINGHFSATPPSPGGQTNNLQSSQAFYVQRTGTGATITFRESFKTGAASLGLFRPVMASPANFRVNLCLLNADNTTVLADGIKVQFNEKYTNLPGQKDVVKFNNIKENLGLLRNGKVLAIENRRNVTDTDTLFLDLTHLEKRGYQLQFAPENLDPLLTAFLEDKLTHIKTPLSMVAPGIFNFTVNGTDPGSTADRFRIVFKSTAGTLPVTFTGLKAELQNGHIVLEWEVQNELNINKYEVEKSGDGVNFRSVTTVNAAGVNTALADYHWLDIHAIQGDNYYRIRSINLDGKMACSNITKLTTGNVHPVIRLQANPVTDGVIWIQFNNIVSGDYKARLFNSLGQILTTAVIRHSQAVSTEKIQTGQRLAPGIYQLEIATPQKERRVIKLMID